MTDEPVEATDTEAVADPVAVEPDFTPEEYAILTDSTAICYNEFSRCANAASQLGAMRLSKADFMLIVEESHVIIDAAIDAMDAIIPDEVP